MGPCIVTADEIAYPPALAISSSVNGEARQKSNTSYMLHSISEIISELSRGITLRAGTIIATGTPAGDVYKRQAAHTRRSGRPASNRPKGGSYRVAGRIPAREARAHTSPWWTPALSVKRVNLVTAFALCYNKIR